MFVYLREYRVGRQRNARRMFGRNIDHSDQKRNIITMLERLFSLTGNVT